MAADTAELFGHVKDAESFHVPLALWRRLPDLPAGIQERWFPGHVPHEGSIPLPTLFDFGEQSLFGWHFHLKLQLTKFMVLELVAAIGMIVVFVWLARRIRSGKPPKGKIWNLLEVMLVFLRDEVARPAIGRHDADRFLPFIWTVFFFILFCNLLGMVPWAGSPTGALGCTLVLALATFAVVVGAGVKKYGPVGFWTGQVPTMELPLVLAVFIKPMVFVIEVFGMLVKHFVLSVRLLANMFAGHLVLAVLLGFIAMTAPLHIALWSGVTVASVFGAVAISFLELFVAFLQAYIFAFLSALFIGMAVHQH